MGARTVTRRALVAALAGLPALGARRPAHADAPPLGFQLIPSKEQYYYGEEIPLTLTVVNQGSRPIRLEDALTAVDFEVLDSQTKAPIPRPKNPRGTTARGTRLLFRAKPELGAPVIHELRPGATMLTDFELLHAYGLILPGRYTVQALDVTPGGTLTSAQVPFIVGPLPLREQPAWTLYRQMVASPTKETEVATGKAFLTQYPESLFADRVRRELLTAAVQQGNWPEVVSLGQRLFGTAIWHGQRQVVGMQLGEGLWQTGRRAEAEALLSQLNARPVLDRLRSER